MAVNYEWCWDACDVVRKKAPQSRQDRAGATQPHPDTIALYQRQIRDLEAELEAANGYIRSLESRCAMQARQLGYG